MSSPPEESSSHRDPIRATLESLVVPVFEELACRYEDGPSSVQIDDEDGQRVVCGMLDGEQLVCVTPIAIDRERTLLRFELEAGIFLDQFGDRALILGTFLEHTQCHIGMGLRAASRGRLTLRLDLTVREDDHPLVFQRTLELVNVGNNLEWYFPLRMPERLRLQNVQDSKTFWQEVHPEELGVLLDRALEAPVSERSVYTLLHMAQGLGRWEDILRLLHEHRDQFPLEEVALLKALAHRGLEQWEDAIEAAEQGGLKDGRFEDEPWLDPIYMHALIEAGREDDALRLLGAPDEDDPYFYDWLRGLAFQRFGYQEGAREAFDRYYEIFPGDLLARESDGSFEDLSV